MNVLKLVVVRKGTLLCEVVGTAGGGLVNFSTNLSRDPTQALRSAISN